jgi:hypothetical protein
MSITYEAVLDVSEDSARSPRSGRKPKTWTQTDRDYETLRINTHALFHHLGLANNAAA